MTSSHLLEVISVSGDVVCTLQPDVMVVGLTQQYLRHKRREREIETAALPKSPRGPAHTHTHTHAAERRENTASGHVRSTCSATALKRQEPSLAIAFLQRFLEPKNLSNVTWKWLYVFGLGPLRPIIPKSVVGPSNSRHEAVHTATETEQQLNSSAD